MSDASSMGAAASLDLRDLHVANIARQAEWCPDQMPDLSFRGNELAGETGEACNVIKKLERERQGWRGSQATKDDLAQELADVVICADLCAVTAGIDLAAAVTEKFNATSEKQGLATKLAALPPPAVPESVRRLIEQAYDAGFDASGEGWNGEYPDSAKADSHYARKRQEDLAPLLAAQPAGRVDDVSGWHQPGEIPAVGRRYVRLYEDGSGAVLLVRHDGGELDCEGNEYELHRTLKPGPWAYTPDGYRFWCEDHGDDLVTLPEPSPADAPAPAPAPAPDSGRGTAEDQRSAWARAAEAVGDDKPWWWDKPWADLGYGSQGDVQAWFQSRDPQRRVVEPDGPDLYVRLHCDPRPHMQGAAPAPPGATGEGLTASLTPEECVRALRDAATREPTAARTQRLLEEAERLEAMYAPPSAREA